MWTTKGKSGTTLRLARSEDGGRSFRPSGDVPGSNAPGNRGSEATAVEHDGRVDVVWLDHREMTHHHSEVPGSHHDHTAGTSKSDGVAMAQKSKLYFASLDGTVAPHVVAAGVCYCCKTSLVIGSDGSLYAAWRHVYPGGFRDIAFSSSRDGGRTFAPALRVSVDKWELNGCPDDGPAIAVDANDRIHVMWPTLAAGSGEGEAPTIALFYALSIDGRQFTPRQRIPTDGIAHHPQIAIAQDGSSILAWDESVNGTRRIVTARATTDGEGRIAVQRDARWSRPGVYPAVTTALDAVVVVWRSVAATEPAIRVARLSARPPASR